MEIDKNNQELLDACKNLYDQLNRIEHEKEKKREEGKQIAKRHKYLKELFYGNASKGITMIVPPKSKLSK